MPDSRPLTGLLLVALLAVPIGSAVTTPGGTAPTDATRAFISDDPDPAAGTLPPFVRAGLRDVVHAENASLANISRMRDFAYPTTQPPYEVGPDQQTLVEYRRNQLDSIHRNDSTSLWLPDSQRSNGTVVKDAHITLLGTQDGVQTLLGTAAGNQRGNESSRLLIPRNGTVLTYLDYATLLPNRTCTLAGDTKTCHSYTLLDQRVNRSVRIGAQTWAGNEDTPRRLAYSGASATAPTRMTVRATITSRVGVKTTAYVRDGGSWQLANTTASETLTRSHTVQDSTPVVVTTNQDLSVTQTIVRSEEGIDRIILQVEGPQTISDRRLWSYARFQESAGRLQNVWGIYSQRQYATATRSHQLLTNGNPSFSPANATNLTQTLAQQLAATQTRREPVAFPNVLELRLTARSRQPALRWTRTTSVVSPPELTRVNSVNLSGRAAPLDQHVNLTSVPPRGATTIGITNVDQPLTDIRDIHNDSIPLTTRTVQEQHATLSTTILNETHARIQLSDARTGEPLSGRQLWLRGAAQGRVATNADGGVVVERRDLYVTVSFTGATNVSQSAYYAPTQTQIAFQPAPFNIYQLLTSLAGALVSVAAFLIFFLPIAYIRSGGDSSS